MTWREDLRRVKHPDGRTLIGGSFRGVAFFVDTSERGGGRRTVSHEFPFRDDPFVEDLGRKARTFRVDAYVLGPDYLTQRDALLSALEDVAGPGQLVHPYHGVRVAIATAVSCTEAKLDGGIAKIAIEFAETPAQSPVPTEDASTTDVVAASAAAASSATSAELVESYDSTGLPAYALASAEAAVIKALAAVKTKLGPIVSGTQELAQLTGQVALLTAQAASLVRAPATICGNFFGAVDALEDTIASAPGDVLDALLAAYDVDLGSPPAASTATRTREAANLVALTSALRRVFAIEAARIAPTVAFVTIDDAIAARDAIAAQLEEQAELAGDTAYPALVDLRSQVLQAVPGASDFAAVVTVTRNVPIPSLLLAYQLYGAVDLEADVIARNAIRHPGFVAGDLQVLNDGD